MYAHRGEFENHREAAEILTAIAEGAAPWAVPVWCLLEFVRVTTHPQIFHPPTPVSHALGQVDALVASPSVTVMKPGDRFWAAYREGVLQGNAVGNLAFDAAIAALCREWNVREILTEDRDFSRFPGLKPLTLSEFRSSQRS